MFRLVRIAPTLLAAALLQILWVLPSLAQTRQEHIRWTHPHPSQVASFRIYYGISPGVYSSSVSVGLPGRDSLGVFHYDLAVPAANDVYVAVTAVSPAGVESLFSNEKWRPAPVAASPTPPPPSSVPPPAPALGSPGKPILVAP